MFFLVIMQFSDTAQEQKTTGKILDNCRLVQTVCNSDNPHSAEVRPITENLIKLNLLFTEGRVMGVFSHTHYGALVSTFNSKFTKITKVKASFLAFVCIANWLFLAKNKCCKKLTLYSENNCGWIISTVSGQYIRTNLWEIIVKR